MLRCTVRVEMRDKNLAGIFHSHDQSSMVGSCEDGSAKRTTMARAASKHGPGSRLPTLSVRAHAHGASLHLSFVSVVFETWDTLGQSRKCSLLET